MSKDPAFLFYSKDFYEGTRMMLPEERACYIDLLIYQHQNGMIPNDLKRVLMYCSGVDEATLKATLQAKFKQTDKGWVNEKLNDVVFERAEFKNKLSINGTIGQFWKKCKAILSAKDYKKLRKDLENIDKNKLFEFLKDKTINETTLKGSLQALLKHYAIEDEDAIKDENINENINEDVESEKPIDFEKVKNIFNKKLPMLPQIQKLSAQRISSINARIKEYKPDDPEIFFESIFEKVSRSDFLIGNNERNWKADFDWILNPNNFLKIIENKYQTNGNRNNDHRKTDAETKQSLSQKADRMFKQ